MSAAFDIPENFYPDLIEKGGLAAAVNSAFSEIHSPARATELDFWISICAYVESINRASQIKISDEERLFHFDFWQNGVWFGSGYTDSLVELARVLHEWFETEISITDLSEKFAFVTVEEQAKYFEQGREVEWKWQEYQKYIPKSLPKLVPFFNEASRNSILRQLFPYISLYDFCFSRCTGFPYSQDCPFVRPSENKLYEVFYKKNELIGKGDAGKAVELVVSHLPVNAVPAKPGPANNLEKAVFKQKDP